jgi:hypothetical protein
LKTDEEKATGGEPIAFFLFEIIVDLKREFPTLSRFVNEF